MLIVTFPIERPIRGLLPESAALWDPKIINGLIYLDLTLYLEAGGVLNRPYVL